MGLKVINENVKNQILMHRIVYLVFIIEGFIPLIVGRNSESTYSVAITSILFVCMVLEELMVHIKFFKKNEVRKWTKLAQCLMASLIFFFWQGTNTSELIALTLIIMLLVDFFRVAEIEKKESVYFYILVVAVPTLLAVATMIIDDDGSYWVFLIFNFLVLFVVLAVEACEFLTYVIKKDKIILEQNNRFFDEVEKNADMMDIQQKMKETNMMLNTQKLELQNANKLIQLSNKEMTVQADILRYIASSFDMLEISNQIADTIMDTRSLVFCAVYIKEDVCLNKHPYYVIKSADEGLDGKLKENMKDIYQYMIGHGVKEEVFNEELKETFTFFKGKNVYSLYLKLLEHEDNSYGLFIAGSNKRGAFSDNMSFYDVVIAQFNIAVKNVRNYSEVQHMARKDGLTGINNRVYFNQLFKKQTEELKAHNGCMSVALFDIDKFKSVNDTYGHLAGDEVIKRIASLTEACIDNYEGFVCRYGGEEFVAVLPGRNIEEAKPVIEELFEIICSQIVEYNEFRIPISVSIGLTAYPEICKNADELLKRADWCMYYAKEHGRHQINVDNGSIQRD